MDRNSEHKKLVLAFIHAFEVGDLSAMDRVLDPNFRDWRPAKAEMSRYEFLRAMEVLFAARRSCTIDVANLISEGDTVAAEMTIRMEVHGEQMDMAQHDLFLFEDQLISALHVYGQDSE
jgi:ketosteroid isomerase-like protein